jgi:hypothetical protein
MQMNFKKWNVQGKYGKGITKIHCVGPFIMLMMGKLLKEESSNLEMYHLLHQSCECT